MTSSSVSMAPPYSLNLTSAVVTSRYHSLIPIVKKQPSRPPDGLYQFNRLPQGLKNSPAVFQRLMNQTLGALRWDVCLAYLDDIVVHSSSLDQHLIDVNRVCKALHTANFRLNYEKCLFFQSHIPFLGHQIVAGGCTPLDDNIRAITQFPTPTSSKAAPFIPSNGWILSEVYPIVCPRVRAVKQIHAERLSLRLDENRRSIFRRA